MPTIRFLVGTRLWSIESAADLSVLDVAIANSLPVSYSCKRGDCGQCVTKLLSGDVTAIDGARPLTSASGIYLCNASAVNDLSVELPHLPELDGIRVLHSPCKIHELFRWSDNVLQVSFRLPASVQFQCRSGQYIRVTNKDRITRTYSLASAPGTDKLLQIHVRRIAGGAFSSYLFESAKLGDLLYLEGPLGQFILRDSIVAKSTIFLATGTGLAPIHAILSALTPEQRARCGELSLYWGNYRPEDAYLRAPIEALKGRLDLKYFQVYSRLAGDHSARHVQDEMASRNLDLSDAQVFASGNPAMIDEARQRTLALGLPPAHFFSDAFTAS